MKAAVIGCGNIYKEHLGALKKAGVEVAAVCDKDEERAKAAAFSGGEALGFEEILKRQDIDAVHICLPHYLHVPYSVRALEAGKNVFCEKPLGMNIKECEELKKAKEMSGKEVGVCFQNRYLPHNAEAARIVSSGEYGKLVSVRGTVPWFRDAAYYSADEWRGKWATEGGGVLINQAIHTLDLLIWMLGDIKDCRGILGNFTIPETEVEDTATVFLKNESGARGILFATNAYSVSAPVEIEVILERARLFIRDGLTVYSENGEVIKKVAAVTRGGEKAYWGVGHEMIIADFYNAIGSGRKFAVGIDEGMKTVGVLEKIYEGHR